MEKLLALQELQLETKPLSLDTEHEILKLRKKVPAPILGHFDRLIAHGKKGVAIVRHGVCGECHLRLTSGTLASLAHADEVFVCDNCGRYLYLPEDEPLGLIDSVLPTASPAKTPMRRSSRRAVAHVV